jgi:hypothetical protein
MLIFRIGLSARKELRETLFGDEEQYTKLLKIKQKYDSQNVLWYMPCVNRDVFREGSDGKLYLS